MNRKALVGIAGTASLLLAAPAMAGSHITFRDRHHSDIAFARVVDVEPIVRYVTVTTPRRECWDEEIAVQTRYRDRRGSGVATIAGGVIGAVVGHQIGDGRGRDAATVVGTLVGSAIGRDLSRDRQERYGPVRYETVTHCSTVDEVRREERIDGYRVTYVYNGREYTTRMNEHPGNDIRLRVSVT
ncbi:MAG: glycine zipper 2TM domain-containing protein, partial [Pseudomonadota bacterium]